MLLEMFSESFLALLTVGFIYTYVKMVEVVKRRSEKKVK
jgi:hypothetical protein